MAQINRPGRRKDQLQAISEALGIIGTVTNLKSAFDAQDKLQQQLQLGEAQTELAKGKLAEFKAGQRGELTPLKQQQLAMSGFRLLGQDEASKLDPVSRQKLVPFTRGGEQVFAFKAPTQAEQQQAEVRGLQKEKLGLEIAKAKATPIGGESPKNIREDKKFLSRELGKAGLPEMIVSLNKIDDALIKAGLNKGIDQEQITRDIPGIGVIAGKLPAVGLSKEGRSLRQLVTGVKNSILKARSGGAVTPSEAERLLAEIDGAGTEREFLSSLRNIRDTVQGKVQTAFAGVSDKAANEWQKASKIDLNDKLFNRSAKSAQQRIAQGEESQPNLLNMVDQIIQGKEGSAQSGIPFRPPGS